MDYDKELREPVYWKMTEIVHKQAITSMDNRAREEMNQVGGGIDISQVHGQAVKNYRNFERFILGAVRFLELIGIQVLGRGADLGSGTGVGACIMARLPGVREVLAIEVSELFVRDIMPVVFEKFGAPAEKLTRVVGDLNALHVPDESLDFLVEIDSYHHSEDLELSARESFRVLKPGGVIIALDRGWPDSTTQAELNAMLDRELNDNLKTKYGVPTEKKFTRRDWGEHEYTIWQWEDTFAKHGFETVVFLQKRPHFPGLNFILTKIPTLRFTYWLASRLYKRARHNRFSIYGWSPSNLVLVFIKPA